MAMMKCKIKAKQARCKVIISTTALYYNEDNEKSTGVFFGLDCTEIQVRSFYYVAQYFW